jgi:glycosyltransferase involved in cell wall biosynthesis
MDWSPVEVGGVSQAVRGLAREIAADGRFAPLIAVASWGRLTLPDTIDGIPLVNVPLHDAYGKGLVPSLKSAARVPADVTAMRRLLRRHSVAIANPHFPSLATAAIFPLMRCLRLYHGKIALSFHGADVTDIERQSGWMRTAWRKSIEAADQVFACSQALAHKLEGLASKARPQVIHNGANLEIFTNVHRATSAKRKHILTIGKYEHKKGHDILLGALQLLLERGVDAQVTIIGGTGPALEATRGAAATFADRVRILVDVPHDRIPEYMQEADVFVLPSRVEPFGIALLEAGAAGLPVVASRVGGIPELITDDRTGRLVEPDDPARLAAAVESLLSDAALADRLAAAWHAEAMNFTWRRAAQKMLTALEVPQ